MNYWFSADPEDGRIYSIFTIPREQLIGMFLEFCPAEVLARLENEVQNVLDGHFREYYYLDDIVRFNATRESVRIRCNLPGQEKLDFFNTDYILQVLRDYNAYYDAQNGRVRPPYVYEGDNWDMDDPWIRRRKRNMP